MQQMTHDAPVIPRTRMASGFGFALTSAVSFGLAGPLARGLMDNGWSAGATVTARIMLAAAVLVPAAVISLRGRWHLVRNNLGLIVGYGLAAVTLAQFAFFNSIRYLPVGMGLLIEYTAPVAVVVWMWLRHGHRPTWITAMGALLAGLGLILVLDVISGANFNPIGVAWALAAMLGAATYFVVSADEDNGLPPLVLAAGGLLFGGSALLLLGALGLVPMTWEYVDATYALGQVSWWLPIVGLGLVTAATSYVTGIAGVRRLGSRLASFVALTEVLAALAFAWLLLAELPRPIQFVGAAFILGGVVVVKLGERPPVHHVADEVPVGV